MTSMDRQDGPGVLARGQLHGGVQRAFAFLWVHRATVVTCRTTRSIAGDPTLGCMKLRALSPESRNPTLEDPVPSQSCTSAKDELDAWIGAVAAQGDRQAFTALFKHFAPRVKGYLMHSGVPAQVADDLAQETMVSLWRHAASFDPARASLSTWIFTIARNLRIDQHRRATANGAGRTMAHDVDIWDADQQPADPQAGPAELALAAQLERGVRQALAELPDEQALLLQRSFFDEQPHASIARDLGIPVGTVKSRIRAAVAQLRRILARSEP